MKKLARRSLVDALVIAMVLFVSRIVSKMVFRLQRFIELFQMAQRDSRAWLVVLFILLGLYLILTLVIFLVLFSYRVLKYRKRKSA
ncbi:hypothetical protein DS831_08030 [Bombilactobacillus bombi]|uniref:Uncharacterized protein n=1 Tax=Bombilactobacillus bombi TaxID=1303590 RepID=A0A417ZFP7_9LACO|nr:hypothetical protein [Bombilactobacillus bombi]RHW50097.1 hypothetical protein DS831_08030 [Bombilactobacillus bombi]